MMGTFPGHKLEMELSQLECQNENTGVIFGVTALHSYFPGLWQLRNLNNSYFLAFLSCYSSAIFLLACMTFSTVFYAEEIYGVLKGFQK